MTGFDWYWKTTGGNRIDLRYRVEAITGTKKYAIRSRAKALSVASSKVYALAA